jgi:hypothetical protein
MQKNEKLSEQLIQNRVTYGIIKEIDCTTEENAEFRKLVANGLPLPEGVYKSRDFDAFYRIADLSNEEVAELIQYKKLDTLLSIRGWCALIGIIMLLGLLGSIFLLFSSIGAR